MHVGPAVGQSLAATRSSPLADTAAKPAESTAAGPGTATAGPLSGGTRTVSLGLFTESEEEGGLSISTFADMVAGRTRDLSKTLMAALDAAKIPTDEPMTFTLDAGGNVTVDGPYKERVEKLLKERPELVKQLKDIAALNSMLALNEAMRRHAETKARAETEDEANQAQADYITDCTVIQSLSGRMVLSDGQLTSGAMSYMAARA